MRRLRIIAVVVVCMACLTMTVACARLQPEPNKPPDTQAEHAQLKALLPTQQGYHWQYSGFAEYGHAMELQAILEQDTQTIYQLSGEIDDPSGGEAPGDYSLSLVYTIRDGVLWQQVTAPRIMDAFSHMELLRAPLNNQLQWEQTVKDTGGTDVQLVCTITEIKEAPEGKIYAVLYQDKNSKFFEKREIQENHGVILFEKLWQGPQESIEMGYTLYREASGVPAQRTFNAYLPALDKNLRFIGLAEYAHQGQFSKVSQDPRQAVYEFNGAFEDGSGIPGQFKVRYLVDYQAGTVQETVLENTRSQNKEVNSKMHDPILLKLPLEVGHSWQQEIDFEGQKKLMTAQIKRIEDNSRYYDIPSVAGPTVTVRYWVENVSGYYRNTYIEERRFEKGLGMVGFSNLMKGDLGLKGDETEQELEQALNNQMFGYSLARE